MSCTLVTNCMDDDTCEAWCRCGRWEQKGFETEDAAEEAWEHHVQETLADAGIDWWNA